MNHRARGNALENEIKTILESYGWTVSKAGRRPVGLGRLAGNDILGCDLICSHESTIPVKIFIQATWLKSISPKYKQLARAGWRKKDIGAFIVQRHQGNRFSIADQNKIWWGKRLEPGCLAQALLMAVETQYDEL